MKILRDEKYPDERRIRNLYDIHGKRVVVTGARGFIGSHLCNRLLNQDAEVHGITRSSHGLFPEGIHRWTGHLEDMSFVKRVINSVKPHYIFHLSGFVNGLRDVEYVPIAYDSLLTSTVNILTAATQARCKKIILTGSQEEPADSSSFPGSPYAAAKWSSRIYARMFSKLYNTPVINPRIFMVYGPAQRDYKKLIPYVILSILRNEPPRLTNGSRPVDWIYVDDVVDSLIFGAVSNLSIDVPFHIGSGTQVTVKDIVNKVVDIMGSSVKPVFGFHTDRPFERIVTANKDKMLVQPRVSLDEGLYRTVQWYIRNFRRISESEEFIQLHSA